MSDTNNVLTTLTKMANWLAKPFSELNKLRLAAIVFWERLSEMLAWPRQQIDPLTADLELVHLLAWERDVQQITGETEQLYRTRVKYALKFAKDAGSVQGWNDMFKTMGVPWVSINERLSYAEWDVISLEVLDADLAERQGLIANITRKYGRTTRRYQYTTIASLPIIAPSSVFEFESLTGIAKINDNLKPSLRLATMTNESNFVVAKQ